MAIPSNFSALYGSDNITARWWVEIEGIRRRYGSWLPSWNPADTGTNRPIRDYMCELPQIEGQSVKPLDGSSEAHSFTVELLDVDDEITALMNVANKTVITSLDEDLDSSETGVDVVDASSLSVGDDIYIDRETMRITGIASNTLTVTRGMYGSTAVEHLRTDALGNTRTVEVRTVPPFMYGREIILYESRKDLVEADAVKLRGFIEEDGIKESDGVWTISATGLLRALSTEIGTTLATGYLQQSLWDGVNRDGESTTWTIILDDNSNFQSSGIVCIDNELIRYDAKSPTMNLEIIDKDITTVSASKFIDGTLGNRGLLGAGIKVSIERAGVFGVTSSAELVGLPNYFVQRHEVGAQAREVISHEAFTAGTRPIEVALQLMCSTGDATNGTYDTLPKGWGAGIDEDYIDVDGMLQLQRDMGLSSELMFYITEPTDLKEWLQDNVFRPCLLFPVETWEGKISLARLMTRSQAQLSTYVDIDEDELLTMPKYEPGSAPYGSFEFNCNYYPPEDKYYGKIKVILGHGLERYRSMAKSFELDCQVLYDWRLSNGTGIWQAHSIEDLPEYLKQYIMPIWQRYSENPCPIYTLPVSYGRMAQLPVGSIVRLTSTTSPNAKTGARSVSNIYCQVMKTRPDPSRSCVELTTWQIGIHDENHGLIAPSAKVVSYTAPGSSPSGYPRVVFEDHTFTDADSDIDISHFTIDDKVVFFDSSYVPLAGATPEVLQIKDIGSNYVDLTTTPTNTPGAGDYMETPSYDSCQSLTNQTDKWVFLSDSGETLGSANDDANVRE